MNKQILKSVFFSLLVVGAVALASSVTLPNSFTSGTPAVAAQVNANFAAVKTAVDDNHTRLTALETASTITAPTFVGSWANVGSPWQTAGYFKDRVGQVHIRGLIKQTAGGTGNIFALPVGFRPSAQLQFPSRCGDGVLCYIVVNTNGNVDYGSAPGATPQTSVSLDGINFDTL